MRRFLRWLFLEWTCERCGWVSSRGWHYCAMCWHRDQVWHNAGRVKAIAGVSRG